MPGPPPGDGGVRPALRLTVATCVPYDPASKGGVGVDGEARQGRPGPAEANLLAAYGSFAELEAACDAFCEQGQRPGAPDHRAGPGGDAHRRAGPAAPGAGGAVTAALGEARLVDDVRRSGSGRSATRSRPAAGTGSGAGRRDGARHHRLPGRGRPRSPGTGCRRRAARGSGRALPAHPPGGPRQPRPKARTEAEAEFLAIGDGASRWLAEAAAAGTPRIRAKMAQAVQLAALHGAVGGPGTRAGRVAGRFADGDLASILAHQAADRARRGLRRRGPLGPAAPPAGPCAARGGRPMTLRQPDQDAVLTAADIALHPPGPGRLRAAPGLGRSRTPARIHRGGRRTSPRPPGLGRTPGALYSDVCLAIDYLDFAPARRERPVTAPPAPPPLAELDGWSAGCGCRTCAAPPRRSSPPPRPSGGTPPRCSGPC